MQDELRGHAEFCNREALGEFAKVQVVLLVAARGQDKEEEVGIAEVVHMLEPLVRVARALLQDGLFDGQACALAGGLE